MFESTSQKPGYGWTSTQGEKKWVLVLIFDAFGFLFHFKLKGTQFNSAPCFKKKLVRQRFGVWASQTFILQFQVLVEFTS